MAHTTERADVRLNFEECLMSASEQTSVDHPPPFTSAISNEHYQLDELCCDETELLPAYSGPPNSDGSITPKLSQSRPWIRYSLAIVYLALLFTVVQVTYSYIQVFRQLVRTQVSLDSADRRGSALAGRVALLENTLADARIVVPNIELASATPADLGLFKWRDTVDLAVAAAGYQTRLAEVEAALVMCEAVKGFKLEAESG